MVGQKLTEKQSASVVKSSASFVITQPEGAAGSEIESVRRATTDKVAKALYAGGMMSAMGPYNGYDVLAQGERVNGTHNGITFTWNDNECEIDGTLAEGQASAYQTIYYSTNSLPYMVKPGGTLRIRWNIDPAWLGIRFHNGTTWGAWVYRSYTTSAGIVVPDDAVGLNVIYGVSASQDHLKVKLALMTETPGNDELQAKIDTMFQTRLSPQAGSDLNDLTDEGHYLLNSNFSFLNAPYNQTYGSFLEVLKTTSSSIMQRITVPTINEVYVRSSASGSFSGRAWKKVNSGRALNAKYVAFGDSLMLGSVWSRTSGGSLHYCDEALKIPTRIARAIGAENNYANEAIGGIGYIHAVDGQNLVQQIKAYDYTGVEIVTIHAGANDKLTEEGTLDAICAAIKEIIDWFQNNQDVTKRAALQKIQLVFMQPLPSGFAGHLDPWSHSDMLTGGGWSIMDFDRRVSKLCRDNHVGYVNWIGCSYCDTWAERNVGYNGNSTKNYTHPVYDEDYALLGDYIAGKVAACANEVYYDNRDMIAFMPFNTVDILAHMNKGQWTNSGVTFTWNDDICTVTGEFSEGAQFASTTLYRNRLSLPYGVKPGDTLRLPYDLNTHRWTLSARFSNGTALGDTVYARNKNDTITVPDNAVGMILSLSVLSNFVSNTSLRVALLHEAGIPLIGTNTDGTYVLKCTVTNGVPTYRWVAE